MARAEQTRGDVMALRRDADAATFSEKAADRRVIPEPELVAGTKSSSAGSGDIGSVFALHLTLPLFDRNQPEHALAVARRSRAEAQLSALQAALRNQISGLRQLVVDRREAADRYRAEAVKSSEELERIAQVSYDAGERGILDLLDAFRRGADARVRQADLDQRAREAELELELVSGWEMP